MHRDVIIMPVPVCRALHLCTINKASSAIISATTHQCFPKLQGTLEIVSE